MSIAQAFLMEFEREAGITRKFLERLPAGQLAWRPHAKSNSAGQLGLHIAMIPGQIAEIAQQLSVPAPDFSKPFPEAKTVEEMLTAHDAGAENVRRLLPRLDDAAMKQTWQATVDGKPIFTLPRDLMIRTLMFSHWIQHRGQLSIYLRLLGAKVPSSYGPSADEAPQG